MCGVAGIYDRSEAFTGAVECVRRMTATIGARGPDAGGLYAGEGVVLGHRRLSILDLSPAAAQPMSLPEGGPTIAFNGEVYNFAALRQQLETLGCTFGSRSDTEVLLHAYDQWGLPGLRRFEGIFAFALWDPRLRRLVLMRDRLGVKPLFYARDGGRLVFGSEIKAVIAAGNIDRTIDEQAFAEYLWYGTSYEDRTIYRSIRALPPGYWLVAEDGGIRAEPWWTLEEWLDAPRFGGDEREAAMAVRRAIDAAVARQLVADVPVGIFLSGGIDSSAVAAAATQVHAHPLSSFTVGFDVEGGVNELSKARRVAHHLGLDHHEVVVSHTGLADVLLDLARAHDEPFADAANIPLFLLARHLRGRMKVVLQGDGGDEMFAGYRRYAVLRHARVWRWWPSVLTPALRSGLGGLGRRLARMAEATSAESAGLRMALLLTSETVHDSPLLLLEADVRRRLMAVANPFLAYLRAAERFRTRDAVQQMLFTDTVLQLPSQYLVKVDRATMACGLEARVPLLDEGVARLAVTLPAAWKARTFGRKIVLRSALRGRIPDDILDLPKTGFGVPYQQWLRRGLYHPARETVLASGFLTRFGFDRGRLQRAFEDHRSGRRERGFTLWKIFQLGLWAQACR